MLIGPTPTQRLLSFIVREVLALQVREQLALQGLGFFLGPTITSQSRGLVQSKAP